MSQTENKDFEYASVYVLDNPYCIDTTYDYYIPFSLQGEICRGSLVTVPFGRGNRRQMALVRELHHCPSCNNVKPIDAVCSSAEPLSDEMLGLCDFMKEQYLCTMGEAVRCVVPSSVIGRMMEYYTVTQDKIPTARSELSTQEAMVYEYIVDGGRSASAIKTKFGSTQADEAISGLLSRRLIKKELVSGGAVSELTHTYYRLAVTKDECNDIVCGRSPIKLRSATHKAILAYLSQCDGAVFSDDLCRECRCTTAQIKSLCEKGLVIKENVRVFRDDIAMCDDGVIHNYALNQEQSTAAEQIESALDSGEAKAILLFGVTGSGKTSVIINAIDKAVADNKGVIMLLPEIALTPQAIKIFKARYKDTVAVVHSGLSAGERADSYSRIRSGEAKVVIGTRSAVFSPVRDLGLIIIDEEHESTYKSDTSPKYHARDIARFRCAYNKAVMLLSSATPSIESYTKAMDGKYRLVKLTSRYGGAELPQVKIYDMRREIGQGNTSPMGRLLQDELKNTVERGEQAILFLNRRGYNTSVSCRSCGEVLTCPNCSISLNYHTQKGTYERGFLFCHWCGYKSAVPQKCPHCDSEHLYKTGFGTQRIEQEICEMLPDKRILRMDADSTSSKNSFEEILGKFKDRQADVLLGTQMVTKGHDFPDVTLVGVLLADMSIYTDDYHANERTFSMLTQVIGRAGRSKKKGMAVIQTNNPDNDTIRLACQQDYESFYNSEIRLRRLLTFPPYCDIALISVTGPDEHQVLMSAQMLRREIDRLCQDAYADVQLIIFGPFESPVYKLEGKYRMRIVIKCRLNRRSRELFSRLMVDFGKNNRGRTAMSINFNPSGL